MGFFFTLLYLILSYLSPDELYPAIGQYRPLLIIAFFALLFSIPSLLQSKGMRSKQSILLMMFVGTIGLSRIAHLWFGGAWPAIASFLPVAVVFPLLVANITSWKRLRIFVIAYVLLGFFLAARGLFVFYSGDPGIATNAAGDVVNENPWLMYEHGTPDANGNFLHPIFRIRGQGVLNDPNDFAQYLLLMLPFVWLAWKRGNFVRNMALVLLPTAFILFAISHTRSRGALIGLSVLLMFALRQKLGTTGSAVLAAGMFLALLALQFTGGRVMGSDYGRLEAWSTGLAMLKSNPVFGVGYGLFTDYHELTAHNSYVLCFAELGLVGLFVWLAMMVISLRQLNQLAKADEPRTRAAAAASDVTAESSPAPTSAVTQESLTSSDTLLQQRWGRTLHLTLVTFLVTSWFLSRTYIITPFMLIALAVALQGLGNLPGSAPQEKRSDNWVLVTAGVEFAVVLLVYITMRVRSL
jgi:putative inorganic carbon (HCO3(-)) transporter